MQNPISPALHAIPDVCPLCREPIKMVDGKFVPGIADIVINGECTVAHEYCIEVQREQN